MAAAGRVALHWFRKGLRLHDNGALLAAAEGAAALYPVFVLDPWFANPSRVGVQRFRFLLQSLEDLDASLRKLQSRLIVVRGKPSEVLPKLWSKWHVTHMSWEVDTEPYAQARDADVAAAAATAGVSVSTVVGHTLHDMEQLVAASGAAVPRTYRGFMKVLDKCAPVPQALPPPTELPPISACLGLEGGLHTAPLPHPRQAQDGDGWDYGVPALEELGYTPPSAPSHFPGGESAALARLAGCLRRPAWVAAFRKPATSPTALAPDTTALSPHLKFGCLSVREFWHRLSAVLAAHPGHSQPPVSLLGQLAWREFYYLQGFTTAGFDVMDGSSIAKRIPWDVDPQLVEAWEHSRTGYPWIDAAMTELRETGWLHHLTRHAVACFLTRGDLYQSWEEGARVFDKYLLDSDWALNNGNWLWLSASAYFHAYFRVYSPVAFPKKTDPSGAYVRKWLPAFATLPDKYVYEPWKAPPAVQAAHGVVVGDTYPARIVVHEEASKANKARHAAAYAAAKEGTLLPLQPGVSGAGATQVGSAPPPEGGASTFRGAPPPPVAPAAAVGGSKRAAPAATGMLAFYKRARRGGEGGASE